MNHEKSWRSVGICGLLIGAIGGLSACTPLKPYEKEYLLEPVMGDDIGTQLTPGLMVNQTGTKEKLSSSSGASASGTSCPTCGG